ncbi:hypothetical protein F2P58_00345 [Vibrio fortis]|uniref:Uncharacterized protein n=1 Tax=Vibrio fortis TaxID=212667 RepID=A0A5N3RBI0_9VIBR|nr:hypothetical protein F2P58_00345 [Vibrio fortis]
MACESYACWDRKVGPLHHRITHSGELNGKAAQINQSIVYALFSIAFFSSDSNALAAFDI